MTKAIVDGSALQSKIEDAEMIVYLSDGSQLTIPVSSAMLEALVGATGMVIHDVPGRGLVMYKFDDETIRNNILPLLPMVK